MEEKIVTDIREYAEGDDVYITILNERYVISAFNEGGLNGTDVDLVDVIEWVKKNKPELLTG